MLQKKAISLETIKTKMKIVLCKNRATSNLDVSTLAYYSARLLPSVLKGGVKFPSFYTPNIFLMALIPRLSSSWEIPAAEVMNKEGTTSMTQNEVKKVATYPILFNDPAFAGSLLGLRPRVPLGRPGPVKPSSGLSLAMFGKGGWRRLFKLRQDLRPYNNPVEYS